MRFKKRKGQIERGYKPRQSSILSHITIQRAKSILSAWSSKLRCAKQTSLDWISKRTIEPGFQGLLNIQPTTFVILLTFNFICGLFILNITDTMRRFLPHLICLTANAAITVAIGRYYLRTINALTDEIEGKYTSENTELRQVFRSFKRKTFKKVNLLPCLVILGVFFWGIFTQHYIKLDLVGCYAVFIVTVVVSISVIGYMQYIWLLWFLVRVNNCSTMYFNRSNPAQTPILVFLAQLTNRVKWCFFIEGFLYVLEYFILIPPAQLSLPSLQMPDNVSFLITWFFLLLVVILAFPVFVIIQETLISKTISKLKHERVEQLSGWFDLASYKLNGNSSPAYAYMYDSMIVNVLASEDYPAKIRRLGPALISVATFCLHAVTLIGQFPQLKVFFQSIS